MAAAMFGAATFGAGMATATFGVGMAEIAWHFERVVVHILHSLPPLLAEAQAPQTHSEAEEEEAIMGGCVCFVASVFLFYVEAQPGGVPITGPHPTQDILGIAGKLLL